MAAKDSIYPKLFPKKIDSAEAWNLFSTTYVSAKTRFLAAAAGVRSAATRLASSGYSTSTLSIELPGQMKGPHGEVLSIDAFVLERRNEGAGHDGPNARPERVLVHTCGVHGVEGFAGSAIQIAFLGAIATLLSSDHGESLLPAGSKILLVHAVNPSGMAWRRRFTAGGNVDINRNCLSDAEFRHIAAGGGRVHRLFLQMRSLHSPTSRVGLGLPLPLPRCLLGSGAGPSAHSSFSGLLVPSGGASAPAPSSGSEGASSGASAGRGSVDGEVADELASSACGGFGACGLRWATLGSDWTYWPQAGLALATYGEPTLRCMIAYGHYKHPDCIYYGGSETMEEESARVLALLREQGVGPENSALRQMIHVDLHTGLGPRAQSTLISDSDLQAAMAGLLFDVDLDEDAGRPASERSVQSTFPGEPDVYDAAACRRMEEAAAAGGGEAAVAEARRALESDSSENMTYQLVGGLPEAVARLAMAGEAFAEPEEGKSKNKSMDKSKVEVDGGGRDDDSAPLPGEWHARGSAESVEGASHGGAGTRDRASSVASSAVDARYVDRSAVLPPPLTVLEAVRNGGADLAVELGLLPESDPESEGAVVQSGKDSDGGVSSGEEAGGRAVGGARSAGSESDRGRRPSARVVRGLGLPRVRGGEGEGEGEGDDKKGGEVEVMAVTQEFGTIPGARVVQALRAEMGLWNQAQREVREGAGPFVVGREASPLLAHDMPERQWLLEAFSPPDVAWRTAVVRQGLDLLGKAVQQLHAPIGELKGRAEAVLRGRAQRKGKGQKGDGSS